jgi:hypothetical protein
MEVRMQHIAFLLLVVELFVVVIPQGPTLRRRLPRSKMRWNVKRHFAIN